MRYWEISIQIRSSYNGQEWPDPDEKNAYQEETRRLFAENGWTVEIDKKDCVCDTVRKGQQELYLHPSAFIGVVSEEGAQEVERLLEGAVTLRFEGIRRFREYFDLSDEDYWARLVSQREEIEAAILERYRTKRNNLYITEGQASKIAAQFSVHRLCDKDGHHNFANLYVGQLTDEMLADGRLVIAQTRHGLGIRTATKRDKRPSKIYKGE